MKILTSVIAQITPRPGMFDYFPPLTVDKFANKQALNITNKCQEFHLCVLLLHFKLFG